MGLIQEAFHRIYWIEIKIYQYRRYSEIDANRLHLITIIKLRLMLRANSWSRLDRPVEVKEGKKHMHRETIKCWRYAHHCLIASSYIFNRAKTESCQFICDKSNLRTHSISNCNNFIDLLILNVRGLQLDSGKF